MASSSIDISLLDYATSLSVTERPIESSTTAFSCMVVTSQDSRRDMFVAAVENAGWDVIQRVTAADASQPTRTTPPHLMIVDLADSESSDDCRTLLENFSQRHGILLLVCGNAGDPMEEIWVRGLGVWLYMPGVPGDADLSSLCADALAITERNASQTFASPTADRHQQHLAR